MLLGAAAATLFAVVPCSASASFTQKSEPTECIIQQHWETTSNGTRYINVDKGACFHELTITHTPAVCPPGPNGEDTSGHWGRVDRTRYYRSPTDFSETQLGTHISGGSGQTRTWRTSLGVSPTTQDLFTEVNGERVLGTDLWRARVGCANSADALSGTQAITLIIRGPNYAPPPVGGGGGGTGGGSGGAAGGGPPPAKPCPEADRLLFQWRYWDLAAQLEQGMALKAEQAVIDYANKGFAVFLSFFNLADFAEDPVQRKALYEQYRLELEGAINIERGFDQADRQLKTIKANIGLFKALGVISTGDSAIQIAEGLYYLGLAAQKGLERDAHRANAKAALEAADSKRESARLARRACDLGKASAARNAPRLGATASVEQKSGSSKKATRRKKKRIYMKQARPKAISAVRLRKVPGLEAGIVRTLNTILAGQSRTTALTQAMGESIRRSGLARKAGSTKWETRQHKWARGYAAKLAGHLEGLARKRESAARSLTGVALLERRLRFADPSGLSNLLRRIGLPVPLRLSLKQLGLSEGPFQRLWMALPGSEVVAPPLAEAVGGADAIATDRAWAADLRRFAAGPR